MKLSSVFENLVLTRAAEAAPPARTGRPRALSDAQVSKLLFKLLRTDPACGPNTGQLGHLFNLSTVIGWAPNIGCNLARLLDGRPLIYAPQGLDTDLLDLDAKLHNN